MPSTRSDRKSGVLCQVYKIMLKVSLILTTYNSAANLPGTLKSIEEQDYPDIEVVIKDGCSTDKTLDIIREFEQRHCPAGKLDAENSPGTDIGNISVISESSPDKGIYDAMNRGIILSSGDVIACFNDTFTRKDAVSAYIRKLEGDYSNRLDAVHSDLIYSEGERTIRTWHMGEGKLSQGWMPGHPSLYLRRSVYDKYGLYKTDYKIAADYEFMVRILKDGSLKLGYIPDTLISMYYGGTSSSSLGSYILSFREGYRALRENNVAPAFIITVKRTIRVLLQFAGKGKCK